VFGSLPPLVIYGGWLVFARLYFGSFWPQTLSAKAAGSHLDGFSFDNLVRQLKIVASTDGVFAALLVVSMIFAGPRRWPSRVVAQRLLPWVWVLAVPALYVARGVPVISRYLLPLLPVLAWLSWRAAERWWCRHADDPRHTTRATVMGSVVALLVLGQNFAIYRTSVLPHVVEFSAGLDRSLVHWGKWFAKYSPRSATIAAPDIGAIGYFSDRRVLDFAGLVTPEMVPVLERTSPEKAVADFEFASFARPDFVVDRADSADDLRRRSRYAACLVPLGNASIPGLGIARPGLAVYSFYRVDWAAFDSLRGAK
jgi:hypothetical protein